MRILGGLMALGYEIGTMLKRTSSVFSDEQLTIKLDDIEGMDKQYVQIQGKDRKQVAAAGKALGLEGTYIARSYIEQVCPPAQLMVSPLLLTQVENLSVDRPHAHGLPEAYESLKGFDDLYLLCSCNWRS